MAELRSGTVTFLFTDIEGSTKLWEKNPEEMKAALAKHDSLLRSIFLMHNGQVVKTTGDGFHAVFTTATDAVQAAIHSQQAIQKDTWDGVTIKVRMGIHTGEAEIRENDYFGQTLNLASRIMSAGHGGQILLSETTMQVAQKHLPGNVSFLDLGQHYFKGLSKAEKVFQATSPDLEQDFPALKSLTYATNNLPAQLTSFIGREKEVEQIKKRLEKSRLVTLTGSGGVGKTRLSIQVASELLNEYPNGVWVVELAPITDPAFVARVICGVLDITLPSNASPLIVLTEYLHAKKLLLVMDNCEHLIETCAQICDSLLHTCPNLRIFASSREALGIDGENSYHVPSLSLPDPKSGLVAIEGTESVKLFMDRATAVLPEFELNQSNASSIAQICKRLDGIPLAIELAASRVKLLKVEQIASRLDDAFRLLTGGSRTALPRQQTLRALINWSYNLLSEQEKILFRRLAVFAGGWTMEAAEAVCSGDGIEPGDVLDLMANLVDKSLIVVTREGTESRYRRLETIRQYAREKLVESGKSETLRNRHMEYYCQLVEQFEPGLRGPDQVILMDSLEIELDNLRAAMEWALDHDVYAGLQLASGLHWLWQVRGRLSEGAGWIGY